jgi:HlyD family secretion protein
VDARKGSVEVKLRVPEPPDFLKPDMTVSAEIEVGRRAVALVLPSEVVRDAGSRPWVLVADDGRAVRRPVRLGLRGTGRVEVVEGLAAGDRVIPPAAPVRAGQRVRVAE